MRLLKKSPTFNLGKLAAGVTAASAMVLALGANTVQAKKFDGVTVNVMTFTGPQIAEPLQRHAPEFKALTGATINIITVPFSDLYTKLLTDFATGTNSVDAAVFAPQWVVDYADPGYLQDISANVAKDKALEESDISPFFRSFSTQYKGKTYLLTLDGDFHMIYYRTDVLKEAGLAPPNTWDEYLAIAKAVNGQDMNGDGKPDYGSCISKKRNAQAYWAVMSIAGGYLQSQGTSQGAFFDTKDMKPLVNNDAFAAALHIYKETSKYAPADEINLDVGDTRGLFTAGRCALTIDWGDVGTLAIDPNSSKVIDKVGAAMLPGSTKVLNRDTGKLETCTATSCPHAVDGINRAPYAAFGGWSGGINAAADDKVKQAAYEYFSYVSQPAQSNKDVTIGATGFNPYRLSQFNNMQGWLDAGMSKEAAENYLGAIKDSLNSPNMLLDLRIPKNQNYQQVVLDTALARYLAGEIDVNQTMETIEEGWDELNEELGKAEQLELYKATLGL
ncbi:MAG: extracellular solute-binding protein [Oceanospirillaceae bacterium]|nr:extracellular solute-binding protein [Oceanospirillaceae bacterium]